MRGALLLCGLWIASACRFSPVPLDDVDGSAGSGSDSSPPIDACETCPPNDLPAGAITISGTMQVSATFANAHDELASGCGPTGARDLFYELDVPTAQVVYVDTVASTFDGVLSIYPGACAAMGSQMSCADNPCAGSQHAQLARSLAAGTYCLVVEDGGNTATDVVLDVVFAGRDGIELAGAGPWNVSGDTCAATDVDDPTCEETATAPGTGKDVMYWLAVCPGSHDVRASTCNNAGFDSIVYMRSESAELACRDDGCSNPASRGSLMTSATTGNGLMMIVVDGWDGECGPYTLNVVP